MDRHIDAYICNLCVNHMLSVSMLHWQWKVK